MNYDIIKVKARRFLAKYFSSVAYVLYWIKFKLINFETNPPLIILTPGKVGSSSIYYTLKKKLKRQNVFHIHFLSKKGIKKAKKNHLSSDRKSLPLHLIISELLLKELKKFNKQIKVITVIREPVSRTVSSFFQNLDFYKNSIEDSNLSINESEAIAILEKKISNSVDDITRWLKFEIEDNFNVNLYEKAFSKKKYVIIKNQKIDLLFLKMEDLNDVFTNSTKEFFNLKKGFILKNYNEGKKKYYSKQYEILKRSIKTDKAILKKIKSSKYYTHFYEKTD